MTGFDKWDIYAHMHRKEMLFMERISNFFKKKLPPKCACFQKIFIFTTIFQYHGNRQFAFQHDG